MRWIAESILVGVLIATASRGAEAAPAAAAAASGDGAPSTCLASAHGAVPSATRYSTSALQAAINACSSTCGTVVVDAPGAYLTASLLLTGCVRLHLPPGVTLLAGAARGDYAATQPDWYLLQFRNCSGCALSGGGAVDGRARLWVLQEPEMQQTGHASGFLSNQGLQRVAVAAGGRQLAGERRCVPSRGGLQPPRMPRKAVRNWRDASCSKPEECRSAVGVWRVLPRTAAGGRLAALAGYQAVLKRCHPICPIQASPRRRGGLAACGHHWSAADRSAGCAAVERRVHSAPPRGAARGQATAVTLQPLPSAPYCRPRLLVPARPAEQPRAHRGGDDPRRLGHPKQRRWACCGCFGFRGELTGGIMHRPGACAPPVMQGAPARAAPTSDPSPPRTGIDVDGSRHVSISAADVDTADDAICLKATSPGHPLLHVVVRDCR